MLKLTGNVTDIASFPALAAYQQYPHCRLMCTQWRMFGLDENYTGDLRTVKINTPNATICFHLGTFE